ncbi:MAG: DEAD/DEAH box helicase [Gaiella sp.]
MSASEPTPVVAPGGASLELLWQQDATAYVLLREAGGALGAGKLQLGIPAVADLAHAGHGISARRIGLRELLALEAEPPVEIELGGTARVTFAIVELARRSVAEGLVHPHLERGDSSWFALWGATLDETLHGTLAELAAALPAVATDSFDGDRQAVVLDLYGCAVDELARTRLREGGVRLAHAERGRGASALVRFLAGLTADDPQLPPHAGYGALETRLSRWVDTGLDRRSPAPWRLSLRLDERAGPDGPVVVLELWLQAADDPSLALPAALLDEGGDDVFAFLRSSDPRRALHGRLAAIEPVLAEGGIVLELADPGEVVLDTEQVRFFLRDALPRLEEQDVSVLLPSDWMRSSSRLRVNLSAKSMPSQASGLFTEAAIVAFDWQLAIGDVVLSESELVELARAKEPLVRVGGRWHALRRTDVDRALRFLERRRDGEASVVELARAVAGLETLEAGVELGTVTLDSSLDGLLSADENRSFAPRATPAAMRHALFPFQERGHGWLRMLSDLGLGGILADDMGLGKTVQAIAMLCSERVDRATVGPTLVVCPLSVTRQWVHELERFAPSLRVHRHHGVGRLAGEELAQVAAASDVVVTSYDIATRDVDDLARIGWERLLLDEAQDAKNPATKRARALRRIPARRKLAMTGTPIENRLDELWAIMDLVNPGLLGSRESFQRTFARPIEAFRDPIALERLRALVKPFVLRRPKDAPEVELELPPITTVKVDCRLTLEQASLYRATVDRWLPRVEAHERSFDRRGAVLAMLGQLKQVCNHPETILPTGAPLEGRSGKVERLVELLTAIPEHDKALVFTQYPGFDQLVTHLAQRLDREIGFFHGRLTARQRDELVEAFSGPDGPRVLVISLRAGGRGLNLPAANHVIHFDRWWNPAVEQQATDRAHRFGQSKPVFVHSLICAGTLEERIDQLLESKRELAEQVIAGTGDDWLAELDLDTIRAAVELGPDAVEEPM